MKKKLCKTYLIEIKNGRDKILLAKDFNSAKTRAVKLYGSRIIGVYKTDIPK